MSSSAVKQGTAEHLSTLLTSPDGNCCEHINKIKPGRGCGIPHRLGFFLKEARDRIVQLDTRNLCKDCFTKAAPEGFSTWSMSYDNETKKFGFFPPQIAAQRKLDAASIIRPDAPVAFPHSAAPQLFEQMRHRGRPFYIDALHLSEPWKPNHPDPAAQQARIAGENGIAYVNASKIYVLDGSGGYGWNTTAEQRIGTTGDRNRIMNPRQDEAASMQTLTPSQTFSWIPTVPPDNYHYAYPENINPGDLNTERSYGGPQNIDAVPLHVKIENQKRPGMPNTYLSDADRVIVDFYSENPVVSHGQKDPSKGTIYAPRWPERPETTYRAMTREDVDRTTEQMTGDNAWEQGDWEKIKLGVEDATREQWDRKEWYSDLRERAMRINAIYERNNVPRELHKYVPTTGTYFDDQPDSNKSAATKETRP